MLSADELNRVLAEVGPLDDAILEVVGTDPDTWLVRFETVDVELEYDGPGGRLVFTVAIGTPSEANRLRIYEALLLYNVIWRDTGGLRMALSGPGAGALQIADLADADIDPRRIVLVAVNMAERALLWRGMMTAETAETSIPFEMQSTGYLRI